MDKKTLKKYTEQLFEYFTDNEDCSGEYLSPTTNAVLAFSEWIEQSDILDLSKVIPNITNKKIDELKQYISDQTDMYLLRNGARW